MRFGSGTLARTPCSRATSRSPPDTGAVIRRVGAVRPPGSGHADLMIIANRPAGRFGR
jgi:hypothetical protein